jgi:hypothetical protein
VDQADDAPGDQVLAIRSATARIERSRRDRSGEREVRDDALDARWSVHHSPRAGT